MNIQAATIAMASHMTIVSSAAKRQALPVLLIRDKRSAIIVSHAEELLASLRDRSLRTDGKHPNAVLISLGSLKN
jgi:hypothetical protein